MKPLEILRNEHGLIRQFIDQMDAASRKIEEGRKPPREFFETAADFAKRFCDNFHHVKEEYMMFVRLAQKKGGEIDGQIEALRHQHEHGRDYMAQMNESLDGFFADHEGQTETLKTSLADYVKLERDHIHTEDHLFFPMCGKEFSDAEFEQLQMEFDKIRGKAGYDTFEECHAMVVEMGSLLQHA
jgi:hemerythrin-like domain-containing protein